MEMLCQAAVLFPIVGSFPIIAGPLIAFFFAGLY